MRWTRLLIEKLPASSLILLRAAHTVFTLGYSSALKHMYAASFEL